MIVDQVELDLIGRSKMRRTMMRLPVKRRPDGSRLPCPVKEGHAYKLKASGAQQVHLTITVVEVRQEKLAALSQVDARKEGYAGVDGALRAWKRIHGEPSADELVWVISFVRGDQTRFTQQDGDVYLAKYGDYTTSASRQAVPGDPPAAILPGAAERARVMALAARQKPQLERLNRMSEDAQTLRESMTSMKGRTRMALIERELGKAKAELPVSEVVRSAQSDPSRQPSDAQSERGPGTCGADAGAPLRHASAG